VSKAAVLGKTTKVDLPKDLFGEPFHQSLVHETARADLAARRRGTASTLTRAEIAMTTAKAWRQKGTGRARAGALSVPNRYGGGVAFGPKPRSYSVKVNRKARRKAMRAALSVHAEHRCGPGSRRL
jgi:large subunit ribosomal protein L4